MDDRAICVGDELRRDGGGDAEGTHSATPRTSSGVFSHSLCVRSDLKCPGRAGGGILKLGAQLASKAAAGRPLARLRVFPRTSALHNTPLRDGRDVLKMCKRSNLF